MALPPTSSNLLQHAIRAHLQIILWKAADQHSPPEESVDITHFGWEFKDGIPIPVIDHSDPAPSELIDIIKCQCKAQGKMCSSGLWLPQKANSVYIILLLCKQEGML